MQQRGDALLTLIEKVIGPRRYKLVGRISISATTKRRTQHFPIPIYTFYPFVPQPVPIHFFKQSLVVVRGQHPPSNMAPNATYQSAINHQQHQHHQHHQHPHHSHHCDGDYDSVVDSCPCPDVDDHCIVPSPLCLAVVASTTSSASLLSYSSSHSSSSSSSSSSSPLSSSSSISSKSSTRINEMKKAVQWNSNLTQVTPTYHRMDITNPSDVWYQRIDLLAFKQECRTTMEWAINTHRRLSTNMEKNKDNNNSSDSNNMGLYCERGLEHWIDSDRKYTRRWRKVSCKAVVLNEQLQQRQDRRQHPKQHRHHPTTVEAMDGTCSFFTEEEEEFIAFHYRKISFGSELHAHAQGLRDEREVQLFRQQDEEQQQERNEQKQEHQEEQEQGQQQEDIENIFQDCDKSRHAVVPMSGSIHKPSPFFMSYAILFLLDALVPFTRGNHTTVG
jgi:hypothetical protein